MRGFDDVGAAPRHRLDDTDYASVEPRRQLPRTVACVLRHVAPSGALRADISIADSVGDLYDLG